MSHSTLKILQESRKLRDEIRVRRERLKRDLAESQKVVAAIIANTMVSITAAKRKQFSAETETQRYRKMV